jgi:hypothetical protein
MSSEELDFASFVEAVGQYRLDERNQKTTSHTSAASVRWDPTFSESTEETRRA